MDKSARAAIAVWSLVLLGGCSVVSGLDQIREDTCAPLCGLGEPDSGHRIDAGLEGGVTAWDGAGHGDGSACGPTDTTENCGACGQTCAPISTSTAAAACSGTSCSYTCGTNVIDNGRYKVTAYLDCNGADGYDPDGCECAATGTNMPIACCGHSCPTQHDVGLSGSGYPAEVNFYDCNPAGTYTEETAMEACTNFEGGPVHAGRCFKANCQSGGSVVCGQDGTLCPCWQYSGTNAGKVAVPKAGSSSPGACYCPGGSSALTTTWQ